jgi:hypothetical protein
MRRDRHREALGAHGETEPFAFGELEEGLEVFEPGEPVAKLPPPIRPLFRIVAFVEDPEQALTEIGRNGPCRRAAGSGHQGFPPLGDAVVVGDGRDFSLLARMSE